MILALFISLTFLVNNNRLSWAHWNSYNIKQQHNVSLCNKKISILLTGSNFPCRMTIHMTHFLQHFRLPIMQQCCYLLFIKENASSRSFNDALSIQQKVRFSRDPNWLLCRPEPTFRADRWVATREQQVLRITFVLNPFRHQRSEDRAQTIMIKATTSERKRQYLSEH